MDRLVPSQLIEPGWAHSSDCVNDNSSLICFSLGCESFTIFTICRWLSLLCLSYRMVERGLSNATVEKERYSCTVLLSKVQIENKPAILTGFSTPISLLHPSLSLLRPFHPGTPPDYFHFAYNLLFSIL